MKKFNIRVFSPTPLQRFLLLFIPAFIVYDLNGILDCELQYKKLFGKTFVMSAEYGIIKQNVRRYRRTMGYESRSK